MCLAQPAKVKSIKDGYATVDFGGVAKEISLGILTGVKIGDYVLVHAGFAIGKVKEEEALETQKILQELRDVIKEELS